MPRKDKNNVWPDCVFIRVNSLNLSKIETIDMKTQEANDKLDAILAKVEKKGVEAPKLIETLKDLRNIALQEQDPLVVKTLRLALSKCAFATVATSCATSLAPSLGSSR